MMTTRTNILAFVVPALVGLVVLPVLNILLPNVGIRVIDSGPQLSGQIPRIVELAVFAGIALVFFVRFLRSKRYVASALLVIGSAIGLGLTYVGTFALYLMTACSQGC